LGFCQRALTGFRAVSLTRASYDSLVALDEALWKQLTLRTFPVPLCAAPPSPTPVRPDFARPG
jgi:hypothetical protein